MTIYETHDFLNSKYSYALGQKCLFQCLMLCYKASRRVYNMMKNEDDDDDDGKKE